MITKGLHAVPSHVLGIQAFTTICILLFFIVDAQGYHWQTTRMSSLYIQITTRCNMTCPHCCFDCVKKGQDITQAHFDAALSLLDEDGSFSMMTIGGGEPTLHKHCMDFAWQAVRHCLPISDSQGTSVVGIVTNGSVKKRALELASMAEKGFISARLSYDRFHNLEMVDDSVRRAFKAEKVVGYDRDYNKRENDLRTTNQMDYFVTPHGRGLTNGIYNHPYSKLGSCCCQGAFVTPDGRIWQCGCREKVVGHLDNLSAFLDVAHDLMDNDDFEIPCSRKPVDKE